MPTTHTYSTNLTWEGSTAGGYRNYDRNHVVVTPPAGDDLALSADPHFRGDEARTNPEQLVVAAASSCQLLSFLAVAARHHVDVLGYRDDADGVMPSGDLPMRISRINLHPRITVATGTDPELVLRLVDEAHESCYIANSLRADVVVDAEVVTR